MADETRRQRRDARRAAGAAGPSPSGEAVAGELPGGTPPGTGRAEQPPRAGFIRESAAELRKVEWPKRNQLIQGTVVVIIACAVVGVFLWGVDQVMQPFVEFLIGE